MKPDEQFCRGISDVLAKVHDYLNIILQDLCLSALPVYTKKYNVKQTKQTKDRLWGSPNESWNDCRNAIPIPSLVRRS